MSEHEQETTFLNSLIRHQNLTQTAALQEQLREARGNVRAIRRAIFAVIVLTLLSASGIGYAAVLLPEMLQGQSHALTRLLAVIGLGSIISLAGFLGFWWAAQDRIRRLHQACRNSILGSLNLSACPNPIPRLGASVPTLDTGLPSTGTAFQARTH